MAISRRNFVSLTAASLASSAVALFRRPVSASVTPAVASTSRPRPTVTLPIKAIAFDALVIFDPRSVFALVDKLFPGRGSGFARRFGTVEKRPFRDALGKTRETALQRIMCALDHQIPRDQGCSTLIAQFATRVDLLWD
jgi:hypothetical protein